MLGLPAVAGSLGTALYSGTEVAMAGSDITLVRNDLKALVDAIELSRRTLATIKANLCWACAYNLAALPLAAAGLLNPVRAGVTMPCSSAIVVTNTLRLPPLQSDGPHTNDMGSSRTSPTPA